MKALKFVTFILLMFGIFSYSDSFAQRRHGHDHHKYERKHYKKSKKYYKKQAHYHKKQAHYNRYQSRRHYASPRWAKAHRYQARHHVYFRDYCTFYDPYRQGYVYWSSNQWIFSPSIPAFLAHVDLGRARIQLMSGVPLTRHPEYYYQEYARSYPRGTNISINFQLPPL